MVLIRPTLEIVANLRPMGPAVAEGQAVDIADIEVMAVAIAVAVARESAVLDAEVATAPSIGRRS